MTKPPPLDIHGSVPLDEQFERELTMIDITAPQAVEVRIRIDGEVLWVNVDGVCRLRVCGIQPTDLTINDERDI